MIDIKDQFFGTEIEMTGITRQRAAEVVAEMFGTEAYYDGTTYGVWSVIDLEGKKWKFMSDGSIYTQRKVYGRIVDAGGEYSTEMLCGNRFTHGGTEGFQATAISAVTDWTIRFHTDVFQRTAVHGKTLMNVVIGDYSTAEISI